MNLNVTLFSVKAGIVFLKKRERKTERKENVNLGLKQSA